jgi:DNA-binding transcriptional ArsR family regulator
VNEEDVLQFTRTAIRSIWALELLLLLHQTPDRVWHEAELIPPLRANARVVTESLAALREAGLVTLDETGRSRYDPASATVREAIDRLADLYRRKPMAVTNAILSTRNDKIQTFADAFRFRSR